MYDARGAIDGSIPAPRYPGLHVPGYTVNGWTDLNWDRPRYAMQFPDVVNTEGTTNAFLDSFLRGNRDDQPRRNDGSILQALNLMNAA